MDRSGTGGGAYLLEANVSIRSGKRKHLLFMTKLGRKNCWLKLGGCWLEGPGSSNCKRPGSTAKAFHEIIVHSMQARNKTSW
jgi:hypothetical protein